MNSTRQFQTLFLMILLSSINLIGCSRENIPVYPQMSSSDALNIVDTRNQKIHTITATGLITLTEPDGDSVRLDTVVVLEPPENARINAKKFGRTIFDMTLAKHTVWIVAPKDDRRRKEFMAAGSNTGKLTHQWLALLTHFRDDQTTVEETETHFILKKPDHEMTITCMIDRKTLTARSFVLTDANGQNRFSLALSHYRQIGDLIWPCRIEAIAPTGQIQIDLDDVAINSPIEPAAFVPPARAEKLEEH